MLEELLKTAREQIAQADSLSALDDVRVDYLGKKGQLTAQLKSLGSMAPEERKTMGQAINQAKQDLLAELNTRREALQKAELDARLQAEAVDITLPGRDTGSGGKHPVMRTMNRIVKFFENMGFDVVEGPEIETDHYNFEMLNFPPHHPARAMHDTFYLPDGRLLRTHTSPVQSRVMEKSQPPLRLIAPGKVFRSDSDQTHTPVFHQIEGLVVDEDISFADLKGTLQEFVNVFFEDELPIRLRPSYFPFTEPSAEMDIPWRKPGSDKPGWLEVLGCGMVHPNVLTAAGIDAEKYTGYAFGLGIERMAMLRYGVDDLRQFFEGDIRFLGQFARG